MSYGAPQGKFAKRAGIEKDKYRDDEEQIDLPINYEKSHFSVRRLAREEYVKRQSGLCWYCKAPLSGDPIDEVREYPVNRALFPENMFSWPVHLHHDRRTGMTIGAVHCRCNAVLWQAYHE